MKANILIRRLLIFINTFAVSILFSLVISSKSLAEIPLFVEAVNARGAWQKGLVTARKVVFTDQLGVVSEIDTNVPREGRYQLLAYVHHNWRNRNAFPAIYLEAVDSKGDKHRGSHMIENIWYLEKDDPGRWFFVSLSENPYWELSEGKLNLKFWIEGKESPWEDKEAPLESAVSVYAFLLLPILEDDFGAYSSLLINPEHCKGDWDSNPYDSEHGANLVESERKYTKFSCGINIPVSAYYKGWLSLFSPADCSLEIRIKNKLINHKSVVRLKGSKEWGFIAFGLVYLTKGDYHVSVRNLEKCKQGVDFLMLLPE